MGIGGYHLYAAGVAGAERVLCHGSCILTFLLLPYNVLDGLASLGLVCVLDPCSLEYSCTVRLIVFGQHDFRTIQPLFMRVIFSSSQFVHFWLSGCASDRCFLYLWIKNPANVGDPTYRPMFNTRTDSPSPTTPISELPSARLIIESVANMGMTSALTIVLNASFCLCMSAIAGENE